MIATRWFEGQQYIGVILDTDQMSADVRELMKCKSCKKTKKLLDRLLDNMAFHPVAIHEGAFILVDDGHMDTVPVDNELDIKPYGISD